MRFLLGMLLGAFVASSICIVVFVTREDRLTENAKASQASLSAQIAESRDFAIEFERRLNTSLEANATLVAKHDAAIQDCENRRLEESRVLKTALEQSNNRYHALAVKFRGDANWDNLSPETQAIERTRVVRKFLGAEDLDDSSLRERYLQLSFDSKIKIESLLTEDPDWQQVIKLREIAQTRRPQLEFLVVDHPRAETANQLLGQSASQRLVDRFRKGDFLVTDNQAVGEFGRKRFREKVELLSEILEDTSLSEIISISPKIKTRLIKLSDTSPESREEKLTLDAFETRLRTPSAGLAREETYFLRCFFRPVRDEN